MTKFPHPNPDVSGELDDRNRMNTLTGTEWMRSCTSYWETEGVYGTLNNEIISRLIKLFSGDMCYYSKKNKFENIPVFNREDLTAGHKIEGPALIIEDETSTYLSDLFIGYINNLNYIELVARGADI